MKNDSRRNRQRGKAAERHVAKALGGKRVGTMGGEDVSHDLLSVEVKSRVRFVGETFMSQAKANCPDGKVPAVVVHLHGKRHCDDLVILRMADFEDLHGRVEVKA